jgi:hypothetical protein
VNKMRLFLVYLLFAAVLFAATALAYYPYGPEYRLYGTDTYLRTDSYPLYYTNYYPEYYTVYSGPTSYTGYYYTPKYFAYPSYAVYGYGAYYPYYYYRDYPYATSYATYYPYATSYYGGSYTTISYDSPSVSVSYTRAYNNCTASWCVRLN